MVLKLTQYQLVLCNELDKLAQIVDPRFNNYILSHPTTLRRHVSVPFTENQECTDHTKVQSSNEVNYIGSLIKENS